jgi:hypothetical protein
VERVQRSVLNVEVKPLPKPSVSVDDAMAALGTFGLNVLSIDEIAKDGAESAEEMVTFDPLKAAATFSGLLTIPDLQSNCVRVEALVHLCFAIGEGQRKPNARHISRWFTAAGNGRAGAMEDPAEDVFVGSVATPRGNFRVLEGIWESGTFYLQRIMNVVESAPMTGAFRQMLETIYALLTLSDLLCARAGLSRNQLGNPIPQQALSLQFANMGDTLRRRIWVSRADLADLGIAAASLDEFIFDPAHRRILLNDGIGHSHLERYPLMRKGEGILFLLPTAVSAAIRRFVVEQMDAIAGREKFLQALASEYGHLMRVTPMLGSGSATGAPVRIQKTAKGWFASVTTSVDEGRYLNLVVFMDKLEGFHETGLAGPNPDPDGLGDALDQIIDETYEGVAKTPGFHDGITLLIACGIGRVLALSLPKKERPGWRWEFLSAADLLTLSWLPMMSPLFLWKLWDAHDRLEALGVTLRNPNGLLNLVAWVDSQRGHLVPHAHVPDEFGSDDRPSFILIEQNALRRVRHEAVDSWDPHVAQDVRGHWIHVRKPQQSQFKEDLERPLYASEEPVNGRWLSGVFETETRPWWFEIDLADGVSGHTAFQRWQMVGVWASRMAAVLDQALPRLPAGPLLWRTRFEGHLEENTKDVLPIEFDQAIAEIAVDANAATKAVILNVSSAFEAANFNVRNVAERALVARTIDGFAQLAQRALSPAEHAAILAKIVPDDQARQIHMFRARTFRDYVQSSIPRSPIAIEAIDGATPKLGLGWRVHDRKLGGDINGKGDCIGFLNSAVRLLEDELCAQLRQFDREATIMSALRNHESAAMDLDKWLRTASAVLALHHDRQSAVHTIEDHEYMLNAVFLATRLLIEFAVCECPLDGGLIPGELDLTRLMAGANAPPGYGGWSDAIRWEAMEPVIKVTPLGDIHAKVGEFDTIMASYGRAGSQVRIEDAVREYPKNLEERGVGALAADTFDPTFLAAWKDEFGASVDDMRRFIDAVEDIGIRTGQAVLRVPESQLYALNVGDVPAAPEAIAAIVDALTLKPRPRWRDTPVGYDEKDRQAWRFRRRLTILRKPLIQIDEDDDPTILVAPGVLRSALGYMLGGYFRGDFPVWQLKPAMRAWAGASSDRRGKEFNREVAGRLQQLGWHVESEVPITKLLRKGFARDYGDVDVLAWRTDPLRVLIVECKDVQFRKTYGEIAEQLADFRGEMTSEGKPDHLCRHLDRMDLISSHLGELGRYLRTEVTLPPESHLVFKNPVPMQFALKRMEARVKVHLFSELANI